MNDSAYGLTASVWTTDLDVAAAIGDRVETGTWYLNRCDYLDPALAWTGVKASGRGSRSRASAPSRAAKSFHLRATPCAADPGGRARVRPRRPVPAHRRGRRRRHGAHAVRPARRRFRHRAGALRRGRRDLPAAPDDCDAGCAPGRASRCTSRCPGSRAGRAARKVRTTPGALRGRASVTRCWRRRWAAGSNDRRRVGVPGPGRPPSTTRPCGMDPPAGALALHFMHQDQIVEVPPGGVVLGRTDPARWRCWRWGIARWACRRTPSSPPPTSTLLADRVAASVTMPWRSPAGLAQPTDEPTIARWMARILTAG